MKTWIRLVAAMALFAAATGTSTTAAPAQECNAAAVRQAACSQLDSITPSAGRSYSGSQECLDGEGVCKPAV
jgi:hypothetical protein